MNKIRVAIITISDRSSSGEREDISGPAIEVYSIEQGWDVNNTSVIPDDLEIIQSTLSDIADKGEVDVIITTGGTGFSPRDVTPEATIAVIHRVVPGIPEAMRAAGMKATPFAMLSRAVAGIRGLCLIINLPGNPKAAIENLQVVSPILKHAIELINNNPQSEAGHNILPSQ